MYILLLNRLTALRRSTQARVALPPELQALKNSIRNILDDFRVSIGYFIRIVFQEISLEIDVKIDF